jgi:hypothetical protein
MYKNFEKFFFEKIFLLRLTTDDFHESRTCYTEIQFRMILHSVCYI